MFRNVFVYRLPADFTAPDWHAVLAEQPLRALGPLELAIEGFVPVFEGAPGFAHMQGDVARFLFARRTKLLPSSVINDALREKVRETEAQTGTRVGGRARRRLRDEILTTLLARAFERQSHTQAIVLPREGWLLVDTTSAKTAEACISAVREALGSFAVTPAPFEGASLLLTHWLAMQKLPKEFAFGDACVLAEPVEHGARWTGRGVDLAGDEVRQHLESGMRVQSLRLGYREHVEFTLTDAHFLLRSLRLTVESDGGAAEDAAGEADAQMALFLGEVTPLLADLAGVFTPIAAEQRKAA
jgi:recombination associated protein RdgC